MINKGLVKRIIVGLNREYGENDNQKGKALYDCIKVTQKGIRYIQSLGTTPMLEELRYYYKSQCSHSSTQVEERFKRTIMTDFMFDPLRIISALPFPLFIKQNPHIIVFPELKESLKFKYIPSIVCKRTNLSKEELEMYLNKKQLPYEKGKSITSSKFYGLLIKNSSVTPIYNPGQYNASVNERNEEVLVNKIFSSLGTLCKNCIYLYQSPNRIRMMVEQGYTESIWQKNQYISSVGTYKEIYLVPYGRYNKENIIIQKLGTDNLTEYYKTHKCFKHHEFIMNSLYIQDSLKNTSGIFSAQSDEHNYYIGFVPELRKLIDIFRYYENYEADQKDLCVICEESQKEFYKTVFTKINKEKKLKIFVTNFTFTESGVKNND